MSTLCGGEAYLLFPEIRPGTQRSRGFHAVHTIQWLSPNKPAVCETPSAALMGAAALIANRMVTVLLGPLDYLNRAVAALMKKVWSIVCTVVQYGTAVQYK